MTATPSPNHHEALPAQSGASLASWGARVGAYIIDVLPPTLLFVVLNALFAETQTTDSSFYVSLSGWPALVLFLGWIGWALFNWGHLQGSTGQTVGKKVLGIAVHGAQTGRPLGFGLSFARQIVHVVDAIPCYLGFLWPLWDKENRTFADMMLSTRVVKR